MTSTIQGSEKAVEKVFCDDYAFSIPPYQRPYAWKIDQVVELLDDLLSFMDDTTPVEKLSPYFLGSIVLIKDSQSAEADVVDGQQRLTTLTILLAAIRAHLPAADANDLTTFLYEQGNRMKGNPTRYRLKLRSRDEVFFRDHIQNDGGILLLGPLNEKPLSDSQRNIRANACTYLNRIAKLSETQRIRLAQFIIRRCFMVVVSTPDFDAAYRIFSVLNSRGLDLTHADVLKSDIIGKLPEAERDHYTEKWEEIEANLGRDRFLDLFSHIRMIHMTVKQKVTLLKEFRDQVLTSTLGRPAIAASPESFIDSVLKPYADAFSMISSHNYESIQHAEKINWLFDWLNWIDNFDWIPPAIYFLANHQNHPDQLLRFFTDLERLAAGMMILRASLNDRLERYGALLRAMKTGNDLYTESSPLQLTAEERTKILKVLDGDVYNTSPRLYILVRLDEALAQGDANYHYPVLSVEHVLPQNPSAGSQWVTWFPVAEKRQGYVHCLGNLVILSRRKNSQASNFDFATKKDKYFTTKTGVSPFAITTQVLREKDWTAQVIEDRQKALLGILKNLWRL